MSKKYVYFFGAGKADGTAKMKELLGGKGANLAEMSLLKVPVPAGFTITTEVCNIYYQNKGKYPPALIKQVKEDLAHVEKIMGMKFSDKKNPLLLSVRSGARSSMPGMMETVLNVGLNEETLQGLARRMADRVRQSRRPITPSAARRNGTPSHCTTCGRSLWRASGRDSSPSRSSRARLTRRRESRGAGAASRAARGPQGSPASANWSIPTRCR